MRKIGIFIMLVSGLSIIVIGIFMLFDTPNAIDSTFENNEIIIRENRITIDSMFVVYCEDKTGVSLINIYRIFNEYTFFEKCIAHGSIIYVLETNEFYLCKRNNARKSIKTGVVRKLNKFGSWYTISKEDLEWLSNKRVN